jgi:hypothetical protein
MHGVVQGTHCGCSFLGAGELEVWYADSPLGPWEQHAANPVMNGARHLGARSGGRPVVFEGKLYRFGQDCGETYGHKVRGAELCLPASEVCLVTSILGGLACVYERQLSLVEQYWWIPGYGALFAL